MNKKILLILIFSTFSFFYFLKGTDAAPSCDINITSIPYTIDQDNTYYCLVQDFYNQDPGDGEGAIEFDRYVENSTLDCLGHDLGGTGGYDYGRYGVFLGHWSETSAFNNTIKNCNISDFDYGIHNSYADNTKIINNTIVSSIRRGINLYYSDYVNIANNTIDDAATGAAIHLVIANHTYIENNSITNSNFGIHSDGYLENSVIDNNIVSGGSGTDIYLSSPFDKNNNIANNNVEDITVKGGDNNLIENNTANGISISWHNAANNPANNNTLRNNTVRDGYGIEIIGSNYNILINNTVYNTSWGIRIVYDASDNAYPSYNNITGGSSHNNTYDYTLWQVDGTNYFRDTNFTSSRTIYFWSSSSWFNYYNETDNEILLKTLSSTETVITRLLTNWNQTLIQWNDTTPPVSCSGTNTCNCTQYSTEATCEGDDCCNFGCTGTNTYGCDQHHGTDESTCEASGCCDWFDIFSLCYDKICSTLNDSFCSNCAGCNNCTTDSCSNLVSPSCVNCGCQFSSITAYYNISGLLSSTYYEIYDNGVLDKTDVTDSDGTLPQFEIDLSGEHEIKVELDIIPTFSNNATNTTLANTAANFTINVTDKDSLNNTAGYIFSTNNSGTWANATYAAFDGSATTLTAWNVTTINSTIRAVVQWRFYANDTSDNWNTSEIFSLTASEGEPPRYWDASSTSIMAGSSVNFNLRWTDNFALSGYIFSFDNCTGSFQNDSFAQWSGSPTNAWSNVTKTISSTGDCTIRWKVYANDFFNNWNVSDVYSFITIPNCSINGYVLNFYTGNLIPTGIAEIIVKETSDRSSGNLLNGYFTLDCFNFFNLQNKITLGLMVNTSDEKMGYNQLIVGSGSFAPQTQKCSVKTWHFNGYAVDSSGRYITQGDVTVGVEGVTGTNSTSFTNGIWDIYHSPCLIPGKLYTFKFIIRSGDKRSHMFLNQVAK